MSRTYIERYQEAEDHRIAQRLAEREIAEVGSFYSDFRATFGPRTTERWVLRCGKYTSRNCPLPKGREERLIQALFGAICQNDFETYGWFPSQVEVKEIMLRHKHEVRNSDARVPTIIGFIKGSMDWLIEATEGDEKFEKARREHLREAA